MGGEGGGNKIKVEPGGRDKFEEGGGQNKAGG